MNKYVFEIDFITPFEVKKLIDKLDANKATGIDGIGPKILKSCGDHLSVAIAGIINNSIKYGVFPDVMKEACIYPVHKGGCKQDANNYRPISILPTLSKIFERHIALQLQLFFKKTNVLHVNQSGFRTSHSCHTALIRLVDTWLKEVDDGNFVGAVFLDLRKAFDLVDHEILLHKLYLHHFSENAVKLFRSYLTNRTQMVKVGSIKSDILPISTGVP